MHYSVQHQHSKITDISTLQFICKLYNQMHIISMPSNGGTTTLSGYGRICQKISDHIQKFESSTSLVFTEACCTCRLRWTYLAVTSTMSYCHHPLVMPSSSGY